MSRLADFQLEIYRKMDQANKISGKEKRAKAQTNLANFFTDSEVRLRKLNLREEVTPLEELRLREIAVKEKVRYRKPEPPKYTGPDYVREKTGLDKFKDDWLKDKNFSHETEYPENYEGCKRVNEWWNEKIDVDDIKSYSDFKEQILKIWGKPMKNSLSYFLMNG